MKNILKNMDLKKQDKILIENSIEKIRKGKSTNFLDSKEINLITLYLNKYKIGYNIFYPYEEASYGIIYNNLPDLSLLRIKTKNKLRHQDIMGSLYNLNLSKGIIGDIVIHNHYDIVVMDYMSDYIINNLTMISRYNVSLEKRDIAEIRDYVSNYETLTLNVSSNRIDLVISKIINKSRNDVIDLIKKKEIILNYDVLSKNNYLLKEGDVFSIHKYGKYKFVRIVGTTKKERLIMEIKKFV